MPKGKGTVVGLNFFPPSCDTGDPRFWNSNSDGAIAMANALAYAGGSQILRKRRTVSKRSLETKNDGATESRVCDPFPPSPSFTSCRCLFCPFSVSYSFFQVRDAQGNWIKDPLQRSVSEPNLLERDPKKKKSIPVKIFGKRLFAKWLSFRKVESST